MNIEEILPELFGEKRVYYCQRCLNHGLEVRRKNHKLECVYRFCTCNDCQMVDKRRELNSRLLQIENTSSPTPPPPSSSSPSSVSLSSLSSSSSSSFSQILPSNGTSTGTAQRFPNIRLLPTVSDQTISSISIKGKERRPNCQRCAQHSVLARLKGHKRCCPFRDCPCAKCQVVQERQKLMADQIKLRRRQKKQKILDTLHDNSNLRNHKNYSDQIVLLNGCLKCAQQALAYQQLLTFIDSKATLEPSIISAILAACPHHNNNNNIVNNNIINNNNHITNTINTNDNNGYGKNE